MRNRKEQLERIMFNGGVESIVACKEYIRLSKIEAFQGLEN